MYANDQPMTGSEDYTFVCSSCSESIEVNESMKAAIEESGCVICGTIPSAADFTSIEEVQD